MKELKIGEWYWRAMGYGGGDSQYCCIRRKTGRTTPSNVYSLCRKEGMGMFKLPVTDIFEAVDECGRVHKVTANDLEENGHIGIGTLETPRSGGHIAWLYREYAELLVESGRYTAEEITAVFPMALAKYDDTAYEAYIEAHSHEFTPMTDKQEEILRAGYEEEQKKKKREEEEAARKYAAEVERLRKVYDYIPCPKTEGKWLSVGEKRRNVLAVLKHEFPGVKFSAKTRNGSMSDSITVGYEDGPAYDKVMKVLREFETTCYNAYEDIHEDCTEPAACVCGGFDYVFLERKTSEDVYKYVHDYIMANVGGASEEYARGKAHKICASTDFPGGGFTIEGMTLGDNGEWTLHIKPKADKQTPPDTPDGNGGGKADGVTVTENAAKHGIEIRFPSIPNEAVRTSMKSNGWRFSYRDGGKWYNRLTEQNKAFALALAESINREVA